MDRYRKYIRKPLKAHKDETLNDFKKRKDFEMHNVATNFQYKCKSDDEIVEKNEG